MRISTTYTEEEEQKIPLLLNAVGISHLQEPIRRPNGIRYYQLFCCTQGKGEVILGGRRCIVHKGQGMFLVPDTPQVYHPAAPGWKVDFVTFSGSLCAQILNSLGLTESDILSYADPEVFHRHILNFKNIHASRKHHKNLLFSEECFSLLVDISFTINRVETVPLEDTEDVIMRIIDYMEQNYMNDISLDDIAAHIGFSKEHICRIFKQNMHETVIENLNKIRISQAARMMLQHPDMTALEIGAKCGFSSPSYFGKIFKRYEGMTPNAYRLNNGR